MQCYLYEQISYNAKYSFPRYKILQSKYTECIYEVHEIYIYALIYICISLFRHFVYLVNIVVFL